MPQNLSPTPLVDNNLDSSVPENIMEVPQVPQVPEIPQVPVVSEESETILYVIECVSVADTEPTIESLVLSLIENE